MLRKRWKWIFLIFLAVTILIVVSAATLCQYLATKNYLSPYHEHVFSQAQKHQKSILKDLKYLEDHPIFFPHARAHDAQDFLSKYISWSDPSIKAELNETHLVISKYTSLLRDWQDEHQLHELLSKDELMHLNLSWLEKLSRYDHWNFLSHPLVKSQILKAKLTGSIETIAILANLPSPDVMEFRQLLLIYFLQQYKKGNAKEGFKTISRAAQILHGSNNLIAEMSSIALLKTKNKLQKVLKLNNEPTVDEESLAAIKRLSWAWIGLSLVPWSGGDVSPYIPYLKPENAACTVLGEISNLSNIKDFFEPPFIFENNMATNFENLRNYTTKLRNICRDYDLDIYDKPNLSKKTPLLIQLPTSLSSGRVDLGTATMINWPRIPFARRLVGSMLITLSTPNWFKQYEDN